MSPRPLSRLRSHPSALCRPLSSAPRPRAVLACTGVDGEPAVVPWERVRPLPALVSPGAALLAPRARPWDAAEAQRQTWADEALDAIRQAQDARAVVEALPPPRYARRVQVEPRPMREPVPAKVCGDLVAALAAIDDVPAYVSAEERLARVRAVVATPGSTRAQMRAAMGDEA